MVGGQVACKDDHTRATPSKQGRVKLAAGGRKASTRMRAVRWSLEPDDVMMTLSRRQSLSLLGSVVARVVVIDV